MFSLFEFLGFFVSIVEIWQSKLGIENIEC